jgi:hypothetical protein
MLSKLRAAGFLHAREFGLVRFSAGATTIAASLAMAR